MATFCVINSGGFFMKKTEFLLKLKLQKGIGYVKLLTIANQLTDETEIEFEELEQVELTDELNEACYRAFQDENLDRLVQQISQQCNVISFFDEAYPEKLRQIYRPPLVLFTRGDISLLQKKLLQLLALVIQLSIVKT